MITMEIVRYDCDEMNSDIKAVSKNVKDNEV